MWYWDMHFNYLRGPSPVSHTLLISGIISVGILAIFILPPEPFCHAFVARIMMAFIYDQKNDKRFKIKHTKQSDTHGVY